jgi:uncharacterized OB-fold protein
MRKNALFSWRNLKGSFELISASDKIEGVIESFTIVHNAPKDFEAQAPYVLALILLNNGKKVTSQIVDCKEVSIGMKVEPCVRKFYSDDEDGLIHYGTKFRVIK